MGVGEAFRYVVIHPGKHDFEAKNPGALLRHCQEQNQQVGKEETLILHLMKLSSYMKTDSSLLTLQLPGLEQWRWKDFMYWRLNVSREML